MIGVFVQFWGRTEWLLCIMHLWTHKFSQSFVYNKSPELKNRQKLRIDRHTMVLQFHNTNSKSTGDARNKWGQTNFISLLGLGFTVLRLSFCCFLWTLKDRHIYPPFVILQCSDICMLILFRRELREKNEHGTHFEPFDSFDSFEILCVPTKVRRSCQMDKKQKQQHPNCWHSNTFDARHHFWWHCKLSWN